MEKYHSVFPFFARLKKKGAGGEGGTGGVVEEL